MNNFDQSSTGVNLNLLCFYDVDRARNDFEDAFHVLQYSGYRQNSILVFNGFGDQDVSNFSFTDLENYNIEKLTAKEIFKAFYNWHYSTDIDHDLKCGDLLGVKELLQELEISNLKNEDHKSILEAIETHIYCDTSYKEFLQSTFECNYLTFESRGYCQGDYSEIVVPAKVYNSYIQNENSPINSIEDFEKAFSDSTFDNLLWDQPLYCRLGIEIEGNEEEFYFDEYMKDQYNYDESEILGIFEKHYDGEHKEYIKEWLEDNLPTQPDCK